MTNTQGCPYGTHRAGGILPQPAERLDTSLPIRSNEILLDVELLNIDSSSLKQIADECGRDAEHVKARIMEIVAARGKMHNPVTKSGGILVGRVRQIGEDYPRGDLGIGDRICPIVSLSLIPLELDAIHSVDLLTTQVRVTGRAILFESAGFGRIPEDFSLELATGLIDICGAPARTRRMLRRDDTVAVLGAGKAGLVTAYAIREALGEEGRLILADIDERALGEARALGVADRVICADLTHPVETMHLMEEASDGQLCNVVVNVTNIGGTEGSTILATRQLGRVLFFGMATTFQVAALAAEGVGRDIEMVIGNGYVEGCVDDVFDLVRRHPDLKQTLERRLAGTRGRQ